MKVRDILDRVTILYHDLDYRRCTHKQYLQFLDDAILSVINYRPDSHEKRVVLKLVPGARQRVPSDGYTLIDVYANKRYVPELDTYFDGKPVYQVSRKDLDYYRNWYVNPEVIHYIDEFAYDIRSPRDFWVNPPVHQLADVSVEIGYSYRHDSLSDMLSDSSFEDILERDIEISDAFRNALVSYTLYKLFSVDVTADRDMQIAQQYLQTFYQALNLNFQSDLAATTRIVEPVAEGIGLHNSTVPTPQSVKQ